VLAGGPVPAAASGPGRPDAMVVTTGKPNVNSLEQAHYLLMWQAPVSGIAVRTNPPARGDAARGVLPGLSLKLQLTYCAGHKEVPCDPYTQTDAGGSPA